MRDMTPDIADLIGLPFAEGGRGPDAYDCYGLLLEVFRRRGETLPDYGTACGIQTPETIWAVMERFQTAWEALDGPETGALVALAYPYPILVSHVGVVVAADRFLHVRRASGVTIDRLSSPAWRRRIRGYYRHVGFVRDRAPLGALSLTNLTNLPVGSSVREVIHAHFPGVTPAECIVLHNRAVDPDWSAPVRPGDRLAVIPRLGFGGDSGLGSIVRPLAMIAVAALAVVTGGAAASAMGFVTTTMTATATVTALSTAGLFVSAAVGTAVTIAGSMIVNALLPPPDLASNSPALSGLSSYGTGSMGGTMTYGWGGPQNSWSPELAIPILYGRMRCGGQIINYYVETNNNNDKQTLYLLIGVCEGEVATPPASADDIYLGNDPLTAYEAYAFATRAGTSDQDVPPGHEKLHQYRELTIKVAKRTLISMHFDSDVVTDASPNARTLGNIGGVTLDTTHKKWGAGSAAFNGSSYLYVASTDWDLYSADFGASLQWLPDLDPATRYYGLMAYGNYSNGWGLFYDQTNDIIAFNILGSWAFSTSPLLSTYGIDLSDGAWHHIEVNRWADDWGIWVDGRQCGYKTSGDSLPAVSSEQHFYVGLAYVDSAWRYGRGNLDELRFVKNAYFHKPGVDLSGVYYPADFTPPAAAYADDDDFVVATRGECDEMVVQVTWPNGLFEVNSSSELVDHDCEFAIYYREVGAGSWIHLDDYTVTARQREPVRRQYPITGLARGKYEVRLARLSAEEASTLKMSDLYWTALDEILNEALAYPYLALLALAIDGSERLNNRAPVVSAVWDRGTITVRGSISAGAFVDSGTMSVASSNPAWAAYDLLTNERYGYRIAPSRLDYATWAAWADWCDGLVDGVKRITLNGILDSQMSLAAALAKICQHGRAQIVQAGQRIRVALEAPVAAPAQVFGPGNILEGSAVTEFLPRTNRPDMYYIEYLNAAYGYRRDKVPIKSAGYDSLTRVPTVESMFLWGCTSEDEARRYGLLRMQMSDRLNRVRTWAADVDAIACLPGDMVVAQDEGNDLTFGGRLGDQAGVADDVIVLDQAICLDQATYDGNCTIWVRLADDSLEARAITGPWDTETDTFNLDADLTGKAQDDVYVIGRATGEAMQYRVTNIARDVDCLFSLSGLEYDETVYYHSDYDGGGTAI